MFVLFVMFFHVEMIRLQLISGQGSRTTAVIIVRIRQKRKEKKKKSARKHTITAAHMALHTAGKEKKNKTCCMMEAYIM